MRNRLQSINFRVRSCTLFFQQFCFLGLGILYFFKSSLLPKFASCHWEITFFYIHLELHFQAFFLLDGSLVSSPRGFPWSRFGNHHPIKTKTCQFADVSGFSLVIWGVWSGVQRPYGHHEPPKPWKMHLKPRLFTRKTSKNPRVLGPKTATQTSNRCCFARGLAKPSGESRGGVSLRSLQPAGGAVFWMLP